MDIKITNTQIETDSNVIKVIKFVDVSIEKDQIVVVVNNMRKVFIGKEDNLYINGALITGTLADKVKSFPDDFFVEAPGEGGTQITYKHPNGDAEYAGSGAYPQNGLAMYIPAQDKEYQFNQLQAKVARQNTDGELFVSIYFKTGGGFGPSVIPSSLTLATPEFSFQVNTTVETKTINVPEIITVPIGYIVLACFYTKTSEQPIIKYWNTLIQNRLTFFLSTSTNYSTILNEEWYQSGGSYYAVPLITLLNKNYASNEYVESVMPLPFTRLPFTKNIPVAQGRELNIWKALSKQALLFTSTVGEHRERCYRLSASAVANTALSVTEIGVNKSYTNAITLKVVSSSTSVTSKQILVIGDSLIAANTIVNELSTLLGNNGTNLFLGTQGTPTHHEGRSGWTFSGFTTSNGGQNPFWDGTKVNFKNYMSVNSNFGGTDTIDICYIQLGINDVYGNTSLSTIIANAKILIAALRADYPSCKIILGIPPISCGTQDGFGKNYGAATNLLTYENAMKAYWSEAILQFDESRYNAAVTVCQSGLWVDRDYGYPKETVDVSARDSADQVSVFSNALHPNTSGYNQIADAVYSHILSLYAA